MFSTTDAPFSFSFEFYQAKLAMQAAAFPLIRSSLLRAMNFDPQLDPQLLQTAATLPNGTEHLKKTATSGFDFQASLFKPVIW